MRQNIMRSIYNIWLAVLSAFILAVALVVFILYWNGQLCGKPKSQRALFEAIIADDNVSFNKYVRKVDINKPTDLFIDRPTPLMYAAKYGNSQMTELLLQNGADPNIGNSKGYAALCYCLGSPFLGGTDDTNDSVKIIKMLVEHGADISGKGITNVIERIPFEDSRYEIAHNLKGLVKGVTH